MTENELSTLLRSTLLAGIPARTAETIDVVRSYNPATVGAKRGPSVTMQHLSDRRVGAMRREDIRQPTDYRHRETQWWETTFQIGALARRKPEETGLLTAGDIAKMASDILQGDAGLAAMGAVRVRPLRVTDIRTVQFTNDSEQYEAYPSFDIVLSHVEIIDSVTPSAEVTQVVARV